jgi:hypothetical protein
MKGIFMIDVELSQDDIVDLTQFIVTGNISDALFLLEKIANESNSPEFQNAVSLGRYNSRTAKVNWGVSS